MSGRMIATVGSTVDEDYVRELLLMMAEADDWSVWLGYSDESSAEERKRYFHALMLSEAGALDIGLNGKDIFRISPAGEAFVAAIADDERWNELKSNIAQRGDYTITEMISFSRHGQPELGQANTDPTLLFIDNAIIIPPNFNAGGRATNTAGVFESDGTPIISAVSFSYGRPRHSPADFSVHEDAQYIPGTHIFGGVFFGHFGHFITESTGRLWALDDPRVNTTSVVYIPKAGPMPANAIKTQTELLLALGITADVKVVDGPTRIERLIVPRQEFGLQPDLISGSDRFVNFARAAAQRVQPMGPEKVYLSRRGLGLDRGTILGEALLEQWLASEGYEIWLPHKSTKEEQVAKYRAAKKIISVDCSPLHLLAYVARPDQKIAIIKRRSMNAVNDIVAHIRSFGDSEISVIDHILANYVSEKAPRVGRSSWGEVDYRKIGDELAALGMISSSKNWRTLTETERDLQISSIEDGVGNSFVRVEP